jgi:tetratricopeptide (TPR) repeat protein
MPRTLIAVLIWSVLLSTLRPPRASAQANAGSAEPGSKPELEQPVAGGARASQNPQELFQQAEAELRAGDLERAEYSFRALLARYPQLAGAYANLGVIYMRRKQWRPALAMLQKARDLAPEISGIRLNIGLTYYREGDFRSAIPSFQSVVKDLPNSLQARYLLGLCYFFTEQYASAADELEQIWSEEAEHLNYLYVLSIAENKAGRADWEQRALTHFVEIGQNSAEFHLLMGKADINHEEYDEAIRELGLANQADPKLPFVHFNLGLAWLKKQDLAKAKAEFREDVAIEPDVAYDYDQLGLIDFLEQRDQDAEHNLRRALRLDPTLASAHFELSRVYQREHRFSEALTEIDSTLRLDPASSAVHYVRGRILERLGRSKEAEVEMQTFTRLSLSAREKRQKELDPESVPGPMPNPEVSGEPQ